MDLVSPTFQMEVKTFPEASTSLTALLHAGSQRKQYRRIKPEAFQNRSVLLATFLNLLDLAEGTTGLDKLGIFMHSKIYYLLRLHCSDAISIEHHDPDKGYSGTFLGHRFYAHPRIRRNTIIVGGTKGDDTTCIIGTTNPDSEQTVIL
jgi:hypothetical protein